MHEIQLGGRAPPDPLAEFEERNWVERGQGDGRKCKEKERGMRTLWISALGRHQRQLVALL